MNVPFFDLKAQIRGIRSEIDSAIDRLVDLADSTDGVVGAQLAGAGLGGCMMVLVRAGALDGLLARLKKEFYQPRKLPVDVHVCTPVAGAGLLGV